MMSYTLTDHSGAFVSSINSVKEADPSFESCFITVQSQSDDEVQFLPVPGV